MGHVPLQSNFRGPLEVCLLVYGLDSDETPVLAPMALDSDPDSATVLDSSSSTSHPQPSVWRSSRIQKKREEGRFMLRYLAYEPRHPPVTTFVHNFWDLGSQSHYPWLEELESLEHQNALW
ncbi:hypothetical protein E4U39_006654, partial [Claviceps sp. Clav50 group G5]